MRVCKGLSEVGSAILIGATRAGSSYRIWACMIIEKGGDWLGSSIGLHAKESVNDKDRMVVQ